MDVLRPDRLNALRRPLRRAARWGVPCELRRLLVNFNWDDALDQIFNRHLVCPRCRGEQTELIVGYARKPSLAGYAPRHSDCADGAQCEARKLITLCADCARLEHFRGESQRPGRVLASYMLDCRHDLDDSLSYLAEYWRDDPDFEDEDLDARFEDVSPDAFDEESALRQQLEEEYLRYHREFRERQRPIPHPGWRSTYVEEIVELGYETLLGD